MTLPCPQASNYAAIAKQLHATALDVEARIFDMEQLLRSAVNRPTLIQTSTTNITITANVEEFFGPNGGGDYVDTFNNTNAPSGTRVDTNNDIFEALGAGVYEVGAYLNVLATGAVNDNSQRQFRIKQQRLDPTVLEGSTTVSEASYTLFEPNIGRGVDCCMMGTFRMRTSDHLDFTILHDNVGSSLIVQPTAIVWLHKVSDATTVTVV